MSVVLRLRQTVPGDSGLGLRASGVDRCPGRHGPRPEGLRGVQTVPGESGRSPRPRGVDQVSRATRARAQGPVGSSRYRRRLLPGSQGPRAQPVLPGHTRLGPRAHVLDQLPGRIALGCNGLRGRPFLWETRAQPEGPRVPPAVTGDLGLGPKTHGVDKLSQVIRAQVRGPAGSTCCPGHLGPVPRA